MVLDVLSARHGSAPVNMATDFLLLQRYPRHDHARFRHYGWHRPAFTFGYSQKIAWVRAQLASIEGIELARRPSGGGLVDHRDDWTYALVLPRNHPIYDVRAVESYRTIHTALADVLRRLGCPAEVKTHCEPRADTAGCGPAGVCFDRAELFDLEHAQTHAKLAGAALKRNQRGLLFQGSISRAACGALDWDRLSEELPEQLARILDTTAQASGWPDFEEELDLLTEQYASPEWLEQR
ncbi:MAG TPA: lipoate--protein ligase family protein [Candidatus Synoicihabitans sp.]|nr:lipoate--protein ligase family protein [Candidatus Synoicihabitans sp.]